MLAALLAPASATPADPASRLRITATPSTLRLAEGSRAALRIVSLGELPVVAASVGRVDGLREVSGGVYEADYVPPDSRDPQIAFVTAQSAEGFAAVPVVLAGVRELVIPAPRLAVVSVSVGDETFGAIPGAAIGEAVVRVAVPPGIRHATYGKQKIDLGVADPALLHVALERPALDANVRAPVKVRAVAVTERGERRARASITLAVSEGSVSPVVEMEPGIYEAVWTVGPGAPRQATATARMGPRPDSSATATLDRVPGPPRSISIETDRTSLVAGEGDEVSVTARLLDVAGHPTEGAARLVVRLGKGDAGQVLPEAVVEWQRNGLLHSGRVRVPSRRAGQKELELSVSAGPLAATKTVALLPGRPREVRVEAEEDLYADGRARAIRVWALDRSGNRVEVEGPPSVTVERDVLGPASAYAPGAYRFEYRSPITAHDFSESVRARLGAVEGETRLQVRAMRGAVVLGPKVGFTYGTGGFTSPAAGLELGFWTRRGLGLVLEGGYTRFSRRDSVGGIRLDTDANLIALQASLAYRRPFAGGVVWLGAGGGGVTTGTTVKASGQGDLSGRAWAQAVHGSLGWGRPLGIGTPFGELKGSWQGDAGGGLLRGSMSSLTLNVGYRFDVF